MARAPTTWRPKHAPPKAADDRERWRRTDAARGSAHQRGYGRRWANTRAGWLRSRPLCVAHLANGYAVEATVLDHVRPHRGDMVLFWDAGNWQGICDECHRIVKSSIEARWVKGSIGDDELRLDRVMPEFFPVTGPVRGSPVMP